MCGCACESQKSTGGSGPSPFRTEVVRLGSKHLYLFGHLTSPRQEPLVRHIYAGISCSVTRFTAAKAFPNEWAFLIQFTDFIFYSCWHFLRLLSFLLLFLFLKVLLIVFCNWVLELIFYLWYEMGIKILSGSWRISSWPMIGLHSSHWEAAWNDGKSYYLSCSPDCGTSSQALSLNRAVSICPFIKRGGKLRLTTVFHAEVMSDFNNVLVSSGISGEVFSILESKFPSPVKMEKTYPCQAIGRISKTYIKFYA